MNQFRSHLQQIVALRTAMFEKLLFDSDSEVPVELAELFEDTGNVYLRLSESIRRPNLRRRKLEVEEHLDAGIEPARRRIQAKRRAEPRVRGTEHLAEPRKDEPDRA